MKYLLTFGFILIFSLAAAIRCTTLGQAILEKPKVELDHVSLREANSSGAIVLFGVKVDNPNAFSLKVDTLKYDVEIGGKHFSSGKIDKPAEVAAKNNAIVEIPVPVKYSDVFSSVLELLTKKTSSYRLKGEASFGLLNIPFDEKGEFKLHE
jgi:LEA14-like dessication related protein